MSEDKKNNRVESEQIWEEIKDLPIAIFALPNQTVKQHVLPLPVQGKDLLLRLNSTAALPALEETLSSIRGKKYVVEPAEGYVVVHRDSLQKEEIKKVIAPFLVVK